ncbi:MAG: sigma-54-dependent Fis family transcriptional regulator [Candidatus Stahlbacteria bacterium]|nr:MAG: sigma-54-dependent Fis family transcriptional regulator [Candidatus Stahlbacteria bacterium]
MKSRKGNVLVIDDEKHLLEVIKLGFEEDGYIVDGFYDPVKAVERFDEKDYDAVISDIRMPGMSGIEVLKYCKEQNPKVVVILITAYSSVESAIESMKAGASDYITKPFRMAELLLRLGEALKMVRIEEMNINLRSEKIKEYEFIGGSGKINEIKEKIKKVAGTDSPILILGESGTGKELVANLIHYNSKRTGKFVPVNCSAFPSELLESELFGYKKGAFTGADKDKDGLFKVANRGTLFLDEISALPIGLQPKLLRAIQTMKFIPLGGTKVEQVYVRIITATNKDIETLVEKGEFREDLYYRLNVIPIYIPPLRERKEDIPILAEFFIEKISKRLNIKKKEFSRESIEKFIEYDWKGNVRELENLIERMIVLEDSDIIDMDSIPKMSKKSEMLNTLNLEMLERQAILKALERSEGKKKKAAQLLGVHPSTLYRKLTKLNIDYT